METTREKSSGKLLLVVMIIVTFIAGGIFGATINRLPSSPSDTSDTSDIMRTDGIITATLDQDGTLTFSGDGAIDAATAWLKFDRTERHQVRRIVIGEGIKSIGTFEFSGSALGYPNLEEVVINAKLSRIDYCAFWNNPNLARVVMNGSVRQLDPSAFDDCPLLAKTDF